MIDLTLYNFGPIELAEKTPDGQLHRMTLTPGDDLSDLPENLRKKITKHWTAKRVAAWRKMQNVESVIGEAADEGGVETIDATAIKQEAARRINTALPDWQQRNMIARSVEILQAETQGQTSVEMRAEKAQIEQKWQWIAALRSRSNQLEQELPSDFRADRQWPAQPV